MFDRFSTRPGRSAAVLFWGSLWGIWEATAGHVIHLTHVPGLPGFIMFPAAFYFMTRVFVRSGRYQSIVLAACLAAGFKLLDIFIPGQTIQAVINPARAILLESLAVAGFYYCLERFSGRSFIWSGRNQTRRG